MNENEADHQHSSPIKTPKQLVVVVVLAFVVPIALIILITQLVTGVPHPTGDDSAVRARIAPVGTIEIAAATAPKGTMAGEQVFASTCKTCHEAGIAGAHKVGDKAAWAKVIAQGEKVTVQHAIAGLKAMPPRGGNASLTDEEVQRGVVFMASKAGATWKEAPVAAAPAATVATAAAAPAAAGPADGKKVFDGACAACHGAGIAGAPKLGDKAAWTPRVAQGAATLYAHAINGFQGKTGVMPPKGGAMNLSDAEIKAAVDTMVAAAK